MSGQRIYIDTSVIGGCFDPEFAPWSTGLFQDFRLGIYRPVVSPVVEEELRRAPPEVRGLWNELLDLNAEALEITGAVLALANRYHSVRSSHPDITTTLFTSRLPQSRKWIA